ncbi:MAG: ATP synthase F1 subunit delta [Actinomycetota bacterium]
MADRDRLIRGYAQGLFAVAEAEGSLEEVEDELFRFGKALDREPQLRDALTDPALPVDRKKAVIRELLGDRANPQTVNVLGFLMEQGRAKDLSRIVAALAEIAAEQRRKAVAEVRSAIPLDGTRRKRLADALARATGKDVELKVLVDPAVIGGVVARVGDQVFDGTIRRRLELARERLAQMR